jgi:hypothetical protein
MTNRSNRPWYKHFWFWFVFGLPFIAVVSTLHFVYLAVVNRDDVVRDNWYEEGKAISQRFALEKEATKLAIHADARLDDLTGEVFVRISANVPIESPTLTLNFQHATLSARDQFLTLQRIMGNDYRAQLDSTLVGTYHVELSDADWRLVATRRFPNGDTFTLDAQ